MNINGVRTAGIVDASELKVDGRDVLTEAGNQNVDITLTTTQTVFTQDQQLTTKKYTDDLVEGTLLPVPTATQDLGSGSNEYRDLYLSGSVQGSDVATASQITALNAGGAAFTHVQDLQNIFHSAGYTSGGAIGDNGDGSISVGAGEGFLRNAASDTAPCYFIAWPANPSVALTDTTFNYIGITWNSGTPIATVSLSPFNEFDTFTLATVYRSGTTLHITDEAKQFVADHANNMIQRNKALKYISREENGGAIVTETGTRGLAITQGRFWIGLTSYTTPAFSGGSFFYYYRSSNYIELAGQTQINNTQYDNAGTLTTLSPNNYGVHWVYLGADGDVYVIFGTQSYTLSDATNNALAPTVLPAHFEKHAILVAKIIIQKDATNFTSVTSAFARSFEGSTNPVNIVNGVGQDNEVPRFDTNGNTLQAGTDVYVTDAKQFLVGTNTPSVSTKMEITDTSLVTPVRSVLTATSNVTIQGISGGLFKATSLTQNFNGNFNYANEVRNLFLSSNYTGAQTVNKQVGLYSEVRNSSTGIATNQYGIVSYVGNSAAGTISNLYSIFVESPLNPTGTVTTAYGVFIKEHLIAGTTSAFGVYQQGIGTTNRFEGQIRCADIEPYVSNDFSLGTGTFRWKDFYLAGLIDHANTSTVTSGTVNLCNLVYTVSPASASTAVHNGIYLEQTRSGTTHTGTMRGIYVRSKNTATSTVTSVSGIVQITTNDAAGTTTVINGYYGRIGNTSTGTVSNAYNIFIASPDNASGTLSNVYGLYLQNQAVGTYTNAYGIYQLGSNSSNYFEGSITINNTINCRDVIPNTDDLYDLGTISKRFDDIYASSGTVNASDQRKKIELEEDFTWVLKLRPVAYKWKDTPEYREGDVVVPAKTYKRKHYGFMAQEVEQLITTGQIKDSGFFVKEGDNYGLRYTELIAPMVKIIQDLTKRIEILEANSAVKS